MANLTEAARWHRQAAALLAEADRAGISEPAWSAVRARLFAQRARFAEAAAGTGAAPTPLAPTPADATAVSPGLGNLSPAAMADAVAMAVSALDAAEALLATTSAPGRAARTGTRVLPGRTSERVDGRGSTTAWLGPRNAVVYTSYSLIVLIFQIVLFVTQDSEQSLPMLAPVCLLALPALAWACGWVTIGAVFRSGAGQPPSDHSARLGAAICVAPGLLLCAGLLALSSTR